MVQSLYICKRCKKQFKISDSESYKTISYIFIALSLFVAFLIMFAPAVALFLLVTAALAYFFYDKSKKMRSKKYKCPFCEKEMVRTGIEERDMVELVESI